MNSFKPSSHWKPLRGFINPHQKKIYRGFFHFLLWLLGFFKDDVILDPIPTDFLYPNDEATISDMLPTVRWINHSTYFVQVAGKSFLLDPIWDERCSPFSFLGPKRQHAPPCKLADFNKLDYVILSHNHYDHLDKKTLMQLLQLHPSVVWVVPLKLKRWLTKQLGIKQDHIIELDWWESVQYADLIFTATPAQHFSGRGLFDRNKTLWMGCVVESLATHKRFYFAGDTGYNAYDFKQIGAHFRGVDLALIPIGAYYPRKFMKPVHINPTEAVQIHEEVGSKLSLGGHWGTFKLSTDSLLHPPYDLLRALEKKGHSWKRFRVLKPGQTINW